MGLDSLAEQVRATSKARFDESGISFAAFHAVVGDSPVLLGYRQLYKLDRHPFCTLEAMLLHPEKSPIYRAWQMFYDRTDEESPCDRRPRGVVFPYAGVRGGLIVHNARVHLRATNLRRWRLAFMVRGRKFVVEHYAHFLAALKDSGWPQVAPGKQPRPIVKSAWLPKAKGAGAKLVLGLLIDVLNDHVERRPTWTRRVALVQRASGFRWVTLTHQEIAGACGLKIHQVRLALRQLRQDKIIVRASRGAQQMYCLAPDYTHDAGNA
jgi:hypothetical protein